jgi:hypothetical protein
MAVRPCGMTKKDGLKKMTVNELIEELKSYDLEMEVVTSDGYGSIDRSHNE